MNETSNEPERDTDLARLFHQTANTPGESEFVHQVTRQLHHRRRHVAPFAIAALGLLLFAALRLGPAGDALLLAAEQFAARGRMPSGWGVAVFMLVTLVVVVVVSAVTRTRCRHSPTAPRA